VQFGYTGWILTGYGYIYLVGYVVGLPGLRLPLLGWLVDCLAVVALPVYVGFCTPLHTFALWDLTFPGLPLYTLPTHTHTRIWFTQLLHTLWIVHTVPLPAPVGFLVIQDYTFIQFCLTYTHPLDTPLFGWFWFAALTHIYSSHTLGWFPFGLLPSPHTHTLPPFTPSLACRLHTHWLPVGYLGWVTFTHCDFTPHS